MTWILVSLACGGPEDLDRDGVGAARDCDDQDPATGARVLSWADQDGDGFGDETIWAKACPGEPGWAHRAGDCDDSDPSEHPEQLNCNCELGDTASVAWYSDQDGDGVGVEPAVQLSCGGANGLALLAGDCEPLDPAVYPGAVEIWYDGRDQDCSGDSDYDADQDGFDSSEAGGSDCDDTAPGTHPEAPEICDAVQADEDCDGLVNGQDPSARGWTGWFEDQDGDGFGQGRSVLACAPATGFAVLDGDCQDSIASINPGMEEICGDGVANDCVETDGECGIHGNGTLGDTPIARLDNNSGNVLLGPIDLLGAGKEHFVVGSPFVSGGDGYVGRVQVIEPVQAQLLPLLSTASNYSFLGSSLATGDLDQDGQQDLVVASSQHYDSGVYGGRVFVALGPIALGSSVDTLPVIQNSGNALGTSIAIVGGFLAVTAPNEAVDADSNGAVFLFGADPGWVSTPLDAAGEVRFDGQFYQAGAQLRPCDVLGSGREGLLFGGSFGPDYESGVNWAESLLDGLLLVDDSDLWVVDRSSEQLGSDNFSCADSDQDGYPELWLHRRTTGEVLAFDSESFQQSQDEAFIRLSGGSGDGTTDVQIFGDLDGDGSMDLVVNDPSAQTYGAISVVYGPLSAGSYSLNQDTLRGPSAKPLGISIAGSDEGLLVSDQSGQALYWVPGGPGI